MAGSVSGNHSMTLSSKKYVENRDANIEGKSINHTEDKLINQNHQNKVIPTAWVKLIQLVCLDNILISSETFEEHLRHLKLVNDRLSATELKLSCICQEVHYLGHVLTPLGIHSNPRAHECSSVVPPPSSVKVVHQLLGLASYYWCFIKGFAKLAHPIHGLTQKGAFFCWSLECEESFQALKASL